MTDARLPWRVRRTRATRGFRSPAVRAAAAELGVDPGALHGTGASGRVTRDDVRGAVAPRDRVVPFNTVRKRAAAALVASKRTSPHALTVVTADFSAVERARAEAGEPLTFLPFVARAVIDALREHPSMNATVEPSGDALVVRRAVHLGIAVDLGFEGLVVPVVEHADDLRLRALARAIREVAARARARQLTADDLTGGTFTLTNPGASGTWISFPIINQPQVGILSTDGVSKRVVVDERGGLRIAPVGHLCLTFDPRAVDAAYAGRFASRVKEIVEARDWLGEL